MARKRYTPETIIRKLRAVENIRLKRAVADLTVDKQILRGVGRGKILSPARRRDAARHVKRKPGCSERRICRALGMARSTFRYLPQRREDESALTAAVTRLASQYGRCGYRRAHALLAAEGWQVSHSRVLRIWRREGLKVPCQQPKRSRLWLNDGS